MEPKIDGKSFKLVSVNDIQEHPRNPNRSDTEPIKESIKRHGFYGCLEVQASTGFILVGNHRYRALVELGAKKVPVEYRDVDDQDAYAILVGDNRIAEFGTRDQEELGRLLRELEDLTGTGFDLADLQEIEAESSGSGAGGGVKDKTDLDTDLKCPKCGYEWSE